MMILADVDSSNTLSFRGEGFLVGVDRLDTAGMAKETLAMPSLENPHLEIVVSSFSQCMDSSLRDISIVLILRTHSLLDARNSTKIQIRLWYPYLSKLVTSRQELHS